MTLSTESFDRLARRLARFFQRVAAATRGELQTDEVVAEAWLMASEMSRSDPGFDPDGPGADESLRRRLWCRLIKHTELNIRHAVQLDHGAAGSEDGAVHPLMHRLIADGGRGPLDVLEHRESAIDEEAALDAQGSLAVAWVWLMRRFHNRMGEVASHLLISPSWAYKRCAQARLLAVFQKPMATPMMTQDFEPGPWRPFPVVRPLPARQLEFDFEDELVFDA